MLRSGFNVMRLLTRQRNTLPMIRMAAFCSEKEPPKGFEKFKRTPKSQTKEPQAQQAVQEKPKAPEPKEEPPNETKEEEKVEPRKQNFKYDPKMFGLGQNDKPKSEQNEEQEEKKKESNFNFDPNDKDTQKLLAGLALLSSMGLSLMLVDFDRSISYTEFVRNYMERDSVVKIVINREQNATKTTASITASDGTTVTMVLGNVDHFLENLERMQVEKGKQPESFIPVEFKHNIDTSKMFDRFINLIYLGVSIVIAVTLYKSVKATMGQGKGGSGDIFGFGKSNVKQFGYEQQVKVKFKDVAGLDEAKNEIKEFVDFLKKPKKYKDIGAKIPRGALLAGPPGTGKTMVAKACAGEAGVPFFYVSGSDFVEMFVGVGASRVRDLFKNAKSKSPSIIFIDEIDAVGRKRESRIGNDERDNTLNQLLVEMDGFGTDQNVVVLAATNRKELLDPALTRPGRFDRTIDINLPDIEGRKQIFMVHLQPLKLDSSKTMDEYARRLATLTPGFSGAEISNLCNEAAILAARQNKLTVDSHDFEMAAERVMAGLEKKKIISEEERRVIAYHESGHAVVSWFLEGGYPLLKLTIIPRSKGSLGYAQYLPNESQLETKQELLDRICCILGGRVAEEHFFKRITTGAYDDLKKAYETAHAIVTKFGMSDNIGYVGYQESEFQKPYSDSTNKKIDDEIKAIIDECAARVRILITEKSADIDRLASALLEKETLDLTKIVAILGQRPFAPRSNYKAYLELKKIEETEETTKENSEDQTVREAVKDAPTQL